MRTLRRNQCGQGGDIYGRGGRGGERDEPRTRESTSSVNSTAEGKTRTHGREALVEVFLGKGEPDNMVDALSQIPALDHLYEEVRADWREALQGQTNIVVSSLAPQLLSPLAAFSFL